MLRAVLENLPASLCARVIPGKMKTITLTDHR